MVTKDITKLIIFIVASIGIAIACCNQGWTDDPVFSPAPPRSIPHAEPIPPAPAPTIQWPEASFYRWESKDIVKAFENNGLEVKDVKPGYTMGPLTPREGMIFLIPSVSKNTGGYVSSYNTEDDLKKIKKHYLKMNKDTKPPAWWIFAKDNILVLISGKVPEEKAREYEKVLKEMDKK